MPAILSKEDESSWLQGHIEVEELTRCLKPYPAEKLTMHPVSSRINSLQNDSSDLLLPAQPADQFGNYTLFS